MKERAIYQNLLSACASCRSIISVLRLVLLPPQNENSNTNLARFVTSFIPVGYQSTKRLSITISSSPHQPIPFHASRPPARHHIQKLSLSRQRPRPSVQPSLLHPRSLLHQVPQSQVFPSSLLYLLRRPLNSKRRMLIRYYIIFILRVDRLVVRRNIDLVIGEFVLAEVFEEVGVAGTVEVDVSVGGVL